MRGRAKRGQFQFKLWFPEGGSFEVVSDRDHPHEEWSKSVIYYLRILERYANNPRREPKEPRSDKK